MRLSIGCIIFVAICCLVPLRARADILFAGYDGLVWGSSLERVQQRFPRGTVVRLGAEVIYKQINPNPTIARRTFGLKDGKLHMVSISLAPRHVQRLGIENLLATHLKSYGPGHVDRSRAPHMLTWMWTGADTKMTLMYAPRQPEMTVVVYEQASSVPLSESRVP